MTDRLASEDVIINAPFSYTGSLQRISRLRRAVAAQNVALRALFLVLVIWPLVALAWAFVTCWYLVTLTILFLPTVCYRLLRRGPRKRKAEALRHRELLGTIASQNSPVAPPQPYRDPVLDRAIAKTVEPLAIEPTADEPASA